MYDLIVIGAGPGGYVTAERAGKAGLKTLLIEKEQLGGVCLNSGCIPTKSLLHAAKLYAQATGAARFGVGLQASYDHGAAVARKNTVVQSLRRGVQAGLKRAGVEVVQAEAVLEGPGLVRAADRSIQATAVILASGSRPLVPNLPGAQISLDSSRILDLERLPASLLVIGGGYIGMEFASCFSMLGVEVIVVEMLDEILPGLDRDFAAILRKSMPAVRFELGARVESLSSEGIEFSRGGERIRIGGDMVLMAVGRRPNVEGLGLEALGVEIDRRGVVVDEHQRTNLPGLYAVGDVTGRSLLAHSASRMGEVALNHILGREDRMRYHAIPWVVFTSPEVAGCGLRRSEAEERGLAVKTARIPMAMSGRYLAEHPGERGMLEVVCDAESGVVLGVTMLGTGCSELIFGAAALIEGEFRARDAREIIFPHPTVSEVLREAFFEIDDHA